MSKSDINVTFEAFKEIQNDAIDSLVSQVIKEKEEIITNRIKHLGLDIDFEQEANKRFKSIVCEHKFDGAFTDEETYYCNDGSDEGFRIVTFLNERTLSHVIQNDNNTTIKAEFNLKYY